MNKGVFLLATLLALPSYAKYKYPMELWRERGEHEVFRQVLELEDGTLRISAEKYLPTGNKYELAYYKTYLVDCNKKTGKVRYDGHDEFVNESSSEVEILCAVIKAHTE